MIAVSKIRAPSKTLIGAIVRSSVWPEVVMRKQLLVALPEAVLLRKFGTDSSRTLLTA